MNVFMRKFVFKKLISLINFLNKYVITLNVGSGKTTYCLAGSTADI